VVNRRIDKRADQSGADDEDQVIRENPASRDTETSAEERREEEEEEEEKSEGSSRRPTIRKLAAGHYG
jgi:hypothetical protein